MKNLFKSALFIIGLLIVTALIYVGLKKLQLQKTDSTTKKPTQTVSQPEEVIDSKETETVQQKVNLEFLLGNKKFSYKEIPLYKRVMLGDKTQKIIADGDLAKKLTDNIPAPDNLSKPVPAKLVTKAPKGFDKLERGQAGQVIDREATLRALENAIKDLPASNTLQIEIVTVKSEGKESFENKKIEMGFNKLIASFSTLHEGHIDDEGRNVNLQIAAEKIDGLIIPPGGRFSFNKVVGPRTEKYGFRKAGVISRGKVIPGLGGGICQVSTTLYRAILQAGLQINERHNHSIYEGIEYSERGLDAAIAWGYKDFKFRNNFDIPVFIVAKSGKGSVSIELYAEKSPYESVRLETRNEKEHPFTTKIKKNSKLKKGETRIVHPGVTGYTVETYRIIEHNGKVKEERMSKDRYLTYNRIEEINN
jgi:vancomycin resistance protein YoaR